MTRRNDIQTLNISSRLRSLQKANGPTRVSVLILQTVNASPLIELASFLPEARATPSECDKRMAIPGTLYAAHITLPSASPTYHLRSPSPPNNTAFRDLFARNYIASYLFLVLTHTCYWPCMRTLGPQHSRQTPILQPQSPVMEPS